ncbi:Ig domain-containing protein [Kitasatospora viridis]|uniref:Putative Ig domain-containing protein n=1 Tax=Kitasatospora viridis TaxID=281105 RepID=A0A561TV62_9ACTN|nr:Ig domain-containing protein [Kitasatospora viridis]TWF90998.1 putative Ig domain-containing protein [Kitasatospora viridis]
MGVSVVFEDGSEAVEVVPGEEAVCVLRVANTGMVVDRVLFDVLGETAEWAHVEPARANLLPQESTRVRIAFRPPRTAGLLPGELPFGLRAMSTEDPEGSRVEEGLVRIGEFGDLGARLVPASAAGRRGARFKLVVENRGNRPESVRVEALDPEVRLGFRIRPAAFDAAPGTATFVRFRAVPRKTFLKGPNRTLPFEVEVRPAAGEAATAEGVMLEKQTLPEWLLPALGAALAGSGLLLGLWFAVLRPVVHSAASAADQAKGAADAAQNANAAAGSAATAAAQAAAGPGKGAPGGGGPAVTGLVLALADPTVVVGGTDPATTVSTPVGAAPKLAWASSDPKVATVSDSGVVTAVGPGTATITASIATAGGPGPAASTPAPTAAPTPTQTPGAPGTAPADPQLVSGQTTVHVVAPLTVATPTLGQATRGQGYSVSLLGSGGTGAGAAWSVSAGALPPGLTLSSGGVLSGTPSTAGTSTFSVRMASTSPLDQSPAQQLSLTVRDAPVVDTTELPGATSGEPYDQFLKADGGILPYTWAVAQGTLPAWLHLDPNTGELKGTPPASGAGSSGVVDFGVQVTDATAQQSAAQHLTLGGVQPVGIGTAVLPGAVVGAGYSQTLTASGGTQQYQWSVPPGTLPAGLSLDAASGTISGTPLRKGSATFTVTATDAARPDLSAQRTFTVPVESALAAGASGVLPAVAGQAIAPVQLTATGGDGSYLWTPTGPLPPGLGLGPDGSSIVGTPTTTGSFAVTVEVTDTSAPPLTSTETLTIPVTAALRTTSTALPPAVVGEPYSGRLTAAGGSGPYSWSSSSPLPPGLHLDADTGTISGTPSAVTDPAAAPLLFAVTDTGAPQQQQYVSLPLTVSTALSAPSWGALPPAVPGEPYTARLPRPDGGSGQYVWTVPPGSLPPGLALTDPVRGTVSGTLTSTDVPHTYAFQATLTDPAGGAPPVRVPLSVTAVAPVEIDTLAVPGAVLGSAYSTTLSATGGTAQYDWSVPPGTLPAGLRLDPATGTISGTPLGAGSSTFTVTATVAGRPDLVGSADFSRTQTLTLTVVPPLVPTASEVLPAVTGQAITPIRLSATGGTGPYLWRPTGSLPPGLTLGPDGSSIVGTPTATGSFAVSVAVTDDGAPPLTATETLTVPVTAALRVTSTSLPTALVGVPYTGRLTAAGGTGPYSWTCAGTLPPGLHLDADTGTISGTPTGVPAPEAALTCTVTDAGVPQQQRTSATLALPVSTPLTFTQQSPLPPVVTGKPYSAQLSAPGGGDGQYAWSAAPGSLPAGLTLSPAGLLSSPGVPGTGPGTLDLQLTLTDTSGIVPPLTVRLPLTVVDPLTVPSYAWTSSPSQPDGTRYAIQPAGGVGPYSYSFDGPHPDWLRLDRRTGLLSWTAPSRTFTSSTDSDGRASFPGWSAAYPANVVVTDSAGNTATAGVTLTLAVPALTVTHPTTLTQTAGAPFAAPLATDLNGGYGSGSSYHYTVTGTLPGPGDTLDPATGVLSGNLPALAAGSFPVTVTVTQTDPADPHSTISLSYPLVITTAPAATPTPTPSQAPSQTAAPTQGETP